MRKHPQIPIPTPPEGPEATPLTQHALTQLREVQAELAERRLEALRLYRPMPHQEEFHSCMASERIVIGGNRCLAGEQKLVDPETGDSRRIDSIGSPFKVASMVNGKQAIYTATAPFIKGMARLYAVDMSNGQQLRSTLEHRVLCDSGWESVEQAWQSKIPLKSATGESVLIERVEYLRTDYYWDITVPGAHNYLAAGVFSHNSGKSLSTFVEDARAATGQDPHNKYPKENGHLVVIGRNWPHVGLVIVPMLFRAGAFKIIRDPVTNLWRAFDPSKDDLALAKPAPPLIPPRYIKDMSWVLKNAGYLNKAELINGWTIHCFSSEGEPPQGFQADLVHIDEDINNERWVGEMQARLADRKGRFVWSAMPHSKNDALLGLSERADKAAEDGVAEPIIKKFTFRFLDNAHIDNEEKKKNIERWSALGIEEVRMRAEGEFTTESTLMYPTFNTSVHIYSRDNLPGGLVPPDWTRYVAIDPGHAVMAAVFGAVPPDEKFLLIYDELYIRQCNALIFGEQFAPKAQEQHFYNFIMDMHGGMLRDLGSGRLPHELYSEELRKRGIRSQISGHSFTPGSDDIPARTAMVRQMLHIRGDGSTKLKVLEGSCPNLLREIKRYRKKTTTVNGQTYVTDEPQTRGDIHAVQCAEYLCAYEPKYHPPPKSFGPEPWWVKWLADKKRRNGGDDPCIILGPMGNRP